MRASISSLAWLKSLTCASPDCTLRTALLKKHLDALHHLAASTSRLCRERCHTDTQSTRTQAMEAVEEPVSQPVSKRRMRQAESTQRWACSDGRRACLVAATLPTCTPWDVRRLEAHRLMLRHQGSHLRINGEARGARQRADLQRRHEASDQASGQGVRGTSRQRGERERERERERGRPARLQPCLALSLACATACSAQQWRTT